MKSGITIDHLTQATNKYIRRMAEVSAVPFQTQAINHTRIIHNYLIACVEGQQLETNLYYNVYTQINCLFIAVNLAHKMPELPRHFSYDS